MTFWAIRGPTWTFDWQQIWTDAVAGNAFTLCPRLLIWLGRSPDFTIVDYTPATDGLLKVNNDHMGFYRVNHDAAMWTSITTLLQTNHQVKLLLRLPLRRSSGSSDGVNAVMDVGFYSWQCSNVAPQTSTQSIHPSCRFTWKHFCNSGLVLTWWKQPSDRFLGNGPVQCKDPLFQLWVTQIHIAWK